MAQYSSASLTLQIKDSGGTIRVLTPFVRAIGSVSIEGILQEATVFGAVWATYVSTTVKKMAPLTLGGFYDTTVDVGPDTLFNGQEGQTRTGCILTYGSTKTTTFDVIIQKYERLPKLGAMTEYQVTLQPTGTVVEA